MLKCALALCGKDLKLVLSRGAGLMQAPLLGLLLVFLFCQRFFVESIERVGIVG